MFVQRKVATVSKDESIKLKIGDMVKITNVRSKPHAGDLIGKCGVVTRLAHRYDFGPTVVFMRLLDDPTTVINSHPINLEMIK